MAQEAGIDWLLLLDHDTLLPVGFLEAASLALNHANSRVGALVPWVYHGACVVSPAKVSQIGTIVPLQYQNQQPLVSDLTAISSGALLYVPMLVKKLPFPNGLWLDYVDHWIFSQIHACGWQIMVFDTSLQHDLSVFAIESLSLARLTSILNGEAAFLRTLSSRARFVYPFRIALRVFRYLLVKPTLAIHTIKWIINRIMNR